MNGDYAEQLRRAPAEALESTPLTIELGGLAEYGDGAFALAQTYLDEFRKGIVNPNSRPSFLADAASRQGAADITDAGVGFLEAMAVSE